MVQEEYTFVPGVFVPAKSIKLYNHSYELRVTSYGVTPVLLFACSLSIKSLANSLKMLG